MSDFHQHGPVTALPRLVDRPIEELEGEIARLARKFPVSLVIPMIPSEMARPALRNILLELHEVAYLHSLVISLNKATLDDYERAVAYFSDYPGNLVIVWNESPAVRRFINGLSKAGLSTGEAGKGRACWLAMGYLLAEEHVDYLAFLDADIANFRREMLARLVLPALDPIVDFDFVKAYYARFSDRLHGRVTRLFLSPLLAAFTRLAGNEPVHPLPVVVPLSAVRRIRRPTGPGLENAAAIRLGTRSRVAVRGAPAPGAGASVPGGDRRRYDHKHQELSGDDPARGLNRMARDVGTHLLRTLAAAGVVLNPGLLESLLAAYQREAEDAVADSYAVASLNGLLCDRHQEELSVQTFSGALRAAIDEFHRDPLGPPLVPNWARVWAGVHNARPLLLSAVAEGAEGALAEESWSAGAERHSDHWEGCVAGEPA